MELEYSRVTVESKSQVLYDIQASTGALVLSELLRGIVGARLSIFPRNLKSFEVDHSAASLYRAFYYFDSRSSNLPVFRLRSMAPSAVFSSPHSGNEPGLPVGLLLRYAN